MAARGVAGDGVCVAGRGVALCFAGWYAQGREAPASKFGKFEATWPSRSHEPKWACHRSACEACAARKRSRAAQKGSRALQDASVECCAWPRSPSTCSPSPSPSPGSRQVCGVCDQAAGACGANPTAEPAPGAAAGSQGLHAPSTHNGCWKPPTRAPRSAHHGGGSGRRRAARGQARARGDGAAGVRRAGALPPRHHRLPGGGGHQPAHGAGARGAGSKAHLCIRPHPRAGHRALPDAVLLRPATPLPPPPCRSCARRRRCSCRWW